MRKVGLFLLMVLSTAVFCAKDKYLFFQDAAHGNLTKLHNNNYLLVLDVSSEQVRYFSEKSNKKQTSGFMPLSNFILLWRNTNHFRENPPNAVISMVTENDKNQQIIVAVVSNPGFDKGKVTYQISALHSNKIQLGEFKHIGLFFDDVSL